MITGGTAKLFGHALSHASSLALAKARGTSSSSLSILGAKPDVRQNPNLGARLFSAKAADTGSANERRQAIGQIKSELTALRGTLQAVRSQKEAAAIALPVPTGTPKGEEPVAKVTTSESRAVYAKHNVYETRGVYRTERIYESQDILGTRDVYETQPVYEQQEIRATAVTGSRDLSSFTTFPSAGIDTGEEFSVKVGNGTSTKIEFAGAGEITATVNGSTQTFNYDLYTGGWRNAVVSALNSVSGLSASITSDGKLKLETADAQSLTIGNVGGGGNPLPELGLTAGTTQSSVVGYQQVVVGEQQVVVGQEEYVVSTEQIEIGAEQVLVGTEQVVVGTRQLQIGAKRVTLKTERKSEANAAAAPVPAASGLGPDLATEKIRDGIKNLMASTSVLVAASDSARGSAAASRDRSAQDVAKELSSTVRTEFNQLNSASSADHLDRAIGRIDQMLGRADSLEKPDKAVEDKLAATHQVRAAANAVLINAQLQTANDGPAGRPTMTEALRDTPPVTRR